MRVTEFLNSAADASVGLATFDENCQIRFLPGHHPVSDFQWWMDPDEGGKCTDLHNALTKVIPLLPDDPKVQEEIAVVGQIFWWPCGDRTATWDFAERNPHIQFRFILLGVSSADEAKRLFPKAIVDTKDLGMVY